METGSIIFDLRKSKKLSQRQLSEIIGVSEETIDKWEEEKELPDIASLIALSKYFGVTVDYILKGEEKNKKNFILATAFNYIGWVIMFFDAFHTWKWQPDVMTNGMVIVKVISVIFMIVGTMIFFMSKNKIKYDYIKKFLRLNIIVYASLGSLIVYLLNIPYLWTLIVYAIIVLVVEIILKIKN